MPQRYKLARKNSITLDDLAGMMKREFDNIGQKLEKLDDIDSRLVTVEQELKKRPTIEQIDLKFKNMEVRLKEHLGEKPLQRDRVLNTKTDMVAHKLGDKSVFTADDVRDVERIAPVAVSPLHQ